MGVGADVARLAPGARALLLDALRKTLPQRGAVAPGEVGSLLFELAEAEAPSIAEHLQARGTIDEFREFAIHRSAYQLKEADPHTWGIPRLHGPPKAAMVEIQADEYGSGDPQRVHSTLFARAMDALGLDSSYGAYLDRLPGPTLATVNLISAFGLSRGWRGALAGHLAMFEIGSAVPNSRYAKALRRLGYSGDALEFFDEHVEADSVHENIAAYDLAQGLARQQPALVSQILLERTLCLSWSRGSPRRWSAPGRRAKARYSPSPPPFSFETSPRRDGARLTEAGAGEVAGALSDSNPISLWVPSQNGRVRDLPQRQSAIVRLLSSISLPSWSSRRIGPRIR